LNWLKTDEKKEIVSRLSLINGLLKEVYALLAPIEAHLEFDCDVNATKAIKTDLVWAMENTSVISAHQLGKAMKDNMGCGDFSRVKR
jgi:hypothetical protein